MDALNNVLHLQYFKVIILSCFTPAPVVCVVTFFQPKTSPALFGQNRQFERIKTSFSTECLVCVSPFGGVCIRTVGVLWPWNGCIIELYMAEPDQRRFTGWVRLHALTLHATVPQGSLPCLVTAIFLPLSATGREWSRGGKTADCILIDFCSLGQWN